MGTFSIFGLNQAYHERYEKLGDSLSDVGKTLDWDVFRPLLESMYANKSGKGSHPNVDVILMFKIQLLEVWYNLSDLAVEREIYDRLSFWHFLGCPDKIPDNSTIWLFRERMSESGVDTLVWQEFQRQLDMKCLKIEQGMIQDATFVYAEPGHCKKDTPRGEQAKTRRDKDGKIMSKNGKMHYGYKLHTIMDTTHDLIRRIETTTANVHDSQVDLSEKGEVVYRDRGYQGAKCKGYSATMKRGARGHPIGIRDKLRNMRISRKRSKGERPYAVIKNIFHAGLVKVTTLQRVRVKNMLAAFCYNIYQVKTIQNRV